VEIRSPAVSLRLLDTQFGEPQWDPQVQTTLVSTRQISSDLFESNSRIATVTPMPILLRDHSVDFFGLSLHFGSRYDGTEQEITYRIDAEGMAPVCGVLGLRLPDKDTDLVTLGYLVAEGVAKIDR